VALTVTTAAPPDSIAPTMPTNVTGVKWVARVSKSDGPPRPIMSA
jgi:hypothetical protein